jgi:hypothetical protein
MDGLRADEASKERAMAEIVLDRVSKSFGSVAVIGRLGSTNWPLCDPASPWQTHGLWHLGAAVAVTWWAIGSREEAEPRITD